MFTSKKENFCIILDYSVDYKKNTGSCKLPTTGNWVLDSRNSEEAIKIFEHIKSLADYPASQITIDISGKMNNRFTNVDDLKSFLEEINLLPSGNIATPR